MPYTQSYITLIFTLFTSLAISGLVYQAKIECSSFWEVQTGETCESIADAWGIPTWKFLSYNPMLDPGCSDLQVGTQYCVEIEHVGPTETKYPIEPVPTQSGSTNQCAFPGKSP